MSIARRWIFIIGCYNSGTTLLENILRLHPDIAGLPNEGQFLTSALITPKQAGIPRLWAEKEELFRFLPGVKGREAEQVKQDWIDQLDCPEAPFAVEKSPTNAARTLWLQHHFHSAYFIHIVRNGYTVALRIRDKVLKYYGPMSDLLKKAAHQWMRSAEVLQEDAPRLKHLLEIRYEELTDNPKHVVDEIFYFLELPTIDNQILFKAYHVHGFTSHIVNQNPTSLARMTEEEHILITSQARHMLEYYGYLNQQNIHIRM